MTRRGRNAALPDPDIRTEQGLLPDGLRVRCFAQGGKEVRNFDFAALPAATGVQRGLAAAFARRTAPGGGLNRIESMRSSYRAARLFCEYLATLPGAPVEVSDLAPSHIDGFLQYRRDAAGSVSENMRIVKLLLRHVEGKSEDLTAKLHEPNPRYVRATQKTSYTREEFKRIAEAARSDLRIAAQRIRNNRQHLERYRAKAMDDPDRRLELLDFVDQQGMSPDTDIPAGGASR